MTTLTLVLLVVSALPAPVHSSPPQGRSERTLTGEVTPLSFPSSSARAYELEGLPAGAAPDLSWQEAQDFDYQAIADSDDVRWATALASFEGERDTQVFRFTLDPQTVADATALRLRWEGYGEPQPGFPTDFAVYDHVADAWTQLEETDFTSTTDEVVELTLQQPLARYLDQDVLSVYVSSVQGKTFKSWCPLLATQPSAGRWVVRTDLLAGSADGMGVDHDESWLLPADAVAGDGSIELGLLEEVHEVTFLDSATLQVIDYPGGSTLLLEEAGHWSAPLAEGAPLLVGAARAPTAATVAIGSERPVPALARLGTTDGWALAAPPRADVGSTLPWVVEATFPPTEGGVHVLRVQGWTVLPEGRRADTGEIHPPVLPPEPTVELAVGAGAFAPLQRPLGVVAGGLPKQLTYVLPEVPSGAPLHLRLRGTADVRIDSLEVAPLRADPVAPVAVLVPEATLGIGGLHPWKAPGSDQPAVPDLLQPSALERWPQPLGSRTALGPVSDLLAEADGRLVVLGPGDGLLLEASSEGLAPPPVGMERAYVLQLHGTIREADVSRAGGLSVAPLPLGAHDSPSERRTRDPQAAIPIGAVLPWGEAGSSRAAGRQSGSGETLATDLMQLDAILPLKLEGLQVRGDETVTATDTALSLNGSVVVDGTLRLEGSTLTMLAPNGSLEVRAGGALQLLDGSVITDPPNDIDDGGVADLRYVFEIRPQAALLVEGSTIRGAGLSGLSGADPRRGLALQSDDVTLRRCTITDGALPLLLLDAHPQQVDGCTFGEGLEGGLLLSGDSQLQLLDSHLPPSPPQLGASARLEESVRLGLLPQDPAGKPLGGADVSVDVGGVRIYATGGFGGTDARSAGADPHTGLPQALQVPVAVRISVGAAPAQLPSITLRAAYGGATIDRSVSDRTPHTEPLTLQVGTAFLQEVTTTPPIAPIEVRGDPLQRLGPKVLLGDVDGDGDLDLFLSGGAPTLAPAVPPSSPNRLLRNDGEWRFTDVTAAAGLGATATTSAACLGDVDGDLLPDLYLVNFGSQQDLNAKGAANALYHNRGDGTFEEVPAGGGADDGGHGTSCALVDYDRDGDLDLYVTDLGIWRDTQVRNETNVLYANDGSGTFSDVTAAAGNPSGGGTRGSGAIQQVITIGGQARGSLSGGGLGGSGMSFDQQWIDIDEDGWLDLVVVNGIGVSPVYHNEGDGTFSLQTSAAGLGTVGTAFGSALGDLDADGHLDLLLVGAGADRLYLGSGQGTMTEAASELGLADPSTGFGATIADLDADGRVDVLGSRAPLTALPGRAWQSLALGRSGGPAIDATGSSGLPLPDQRSVGNAVGDLDGDGAPEVVMVTTDGTVAIGRNLQPSAHALRVHLESSLSPPGGVGGWIRLLDGAGAPLVAAPLGGTGGTRAQPQGQADIAVPSVATGLQVFWPSGLVQSLTLADLPATADGGVQVVERTHLVSAPDLPPRVDEGTTLPLTLGNSTSDSPSFPAQVEAHWTIVDPIGGTTERQGVGSTLTFSIPGNYTLTLDLQEGPRSSANATVSVQVRDRTAPVVVLGANRTVVAGTRLHLSAIRLTDNDPRFSLSGHTTWRIEGPGGVQEFSGPTPSVTLTTPGTHRVTVTVRDGAGNSADATQTIVVADPAVLGLQPWQWYLLIALVLGVVVTVAANREGDKRRAAVRRRKGPRRRGRPRRSSTSEE